MANTRVFNSLGAIASDAVQVTDDVGVREQGTAYRKTNLSDVQQIEGEPYDEPPITENINQKLFNCSSFTDLINRTGIPGWTNTVDYAPPAVVWGFDGTPGTGDFYICLRASGPSTSPVDPLFDDQSRPVFWRILENPEQLRLDLADQTHGTEGSRLVGYNNFNTNGGVDDGLTTKESLDNLYRSSIPGVNINVLASLDVRIDTTPAPGAPLILFVDTFSSLNVDVSTYFAIGEITVDINKKAQGIRVSYLNAIPPDYLILNCQYTQGAGSHGSGSTNSKNSRTTISYLNKLANSVEAYGQSINQDDSGPGISGEPIFRFNFICYEIVI